MLTNLLRVFARAIVVLAAFALIGFALSPVGNMISSGFLKTERPFTKDLKVRVPSDDHSDQAELFLLLVIVHDAMKEQQTLNPSSRTESDKKRAIRGIVEVKFDR